jgi:hypothetical protein
MRAEVNKGQILNKFKGAEDFIEDAKAETYIDNHNVASGNQAPVTSRTTSEGRDGYYDLEGDAYNALAPRAERDEARQRLYSQILELPDGWKRASFSNSSEHFNSVEYGENWRHTEGYAVYTSLRAAWPQLKADAVAEAEARSKL